MGDKGFQSLSQFIRTSNARTGFEEGIIRLGALPKEDSVIEVAALGSGEQSGKFHRKHHTWIRNRQCKEKATAIHHGHFRLIRNALVLRLHFHQETLVAMATQTQLKQQLRKENVSPKSRQSFIGLITRLNLQAIHSHPSRYVCEMRHCWQFVTDKNRVKWKFQSWR